MKPIKTINVPTGHICIADGDHGKLEFLSISDYGKHKNIKADFLGLTKEIQGVPNGPIMGFAEKWVVTVSSQYGCSMGCNFCDAPKVGPGRNVTTADLTLQVTEALKLHPEIESTKRLNVHYARMGEPTINSDVLKHARGLKREIRPFIGRSHVHPVVSTMMPKMNKYLPHFLQEWCEIKNYDYRGAAGLQISINSTSDVQRNKMFGGDSLSLQEVHDICNLLPDPVGRKYALNFALADGYEVDANKLRDLFHPSKFMVKITPIHLTQACLENDIETKLGYHHYTPYQKVEEELKAEGFDVLVFIPSMDEDNSRITCGNAILSDKN